MSLELGLGPIGNWTSLLQDVVRKRVRDEVGCGSSASG